MKRLSYTQLSSFMVCPRKYWWQYKAKIQPAKTPVAFLTGRAVHNGIERISLGLPVGDVVNEVFDAARLSEVKTPEDLQRWELERAKAHAMVEGYLHRYGSDYRSWDRTLAEKEFQIPLTRESCYFGKIDLMYEKDQTWTLRETKTAARPDANYFLRLPLDWQILGYVYAAKDTFDIDVARVEYDVIVKPAIRLKVKESADEFRERCVLEYTKHGDAKNMFIRELVTVPPAQVWLWRQQAEHVATLMEEAARSKKYYQNPESCINKYGGCSFLDACVSRRANPLLYVKKTYN